MDLPLSGWGYGPAPFPYLLSPSLAKLMFFRATRCIYVYQAAQTAPQSTHFDRTLSPDFTFEELEAGRTSPHTATTHEDRARQVGCLIPHFFNPDLT